MVDCYSELGVHLGMNTAVRHYMQWEEENEVLEFHGSQIIRFQSNSEQIINELT